MFRVIIILLLLSASTSKNFATTINIMTFNCHNLFDTKHDDNKNDYDFLPKPKKNSRRCSKDNWDAEVLNHKLDNVAAVIKNVFKGRGADIVFLQEIENRAVLKRLVNEKLSGMKYTTIIHLESNDPRGIDQAILSRYPINKKEQVIFNPNMKNDDKRGILTARIKINQSFYSLMNVHLPAPFHNADQRRKMIEHINKVKKEIEDKHPNEKIILAGDFNITDEEEAKNSYHELFSKEWFSTISNSNKTSQGTIYYAPEKQWSFFDRIYLSKNLDSRFIKNSVKVYQELRLQKNTKGTPQKFNRCRLNGVSDHFPLILQIKI